MGGKDVHVHIVAQLAGKLQAWKQHRRLIGRSVSYEWSVDGEVGPPPGAAGEHVNIRWQFRPACSLRHKPQMQFTGRNVGHPTLFLTCIIL